VCDAIAHAHSKPIIHRDIKAGNVLTFMSNDRPTAKVIDFGIAKALSDERLTDRAVNTVDNRIVGTYINMSPEQAEGSPDLDTRSDVYSLGVLLYELLTGAQPFDAEVLNKASDLEARRVVREVEPPQPSSRLATMGAEAATIAHRRQTKPEPCAASCAANWNGSR
jgi:eukaryotic-like serine/threonine-protein kinase